MPRLSYVMTWRPWSRAATSRQAHAPWPRPATRRTLSSAARRPSPCPGRRRRTSSRGRSSRRPSSRSFRSVHMIRAPVIPYGWPSAIAPPCGFSFSPNGSTPSSRQTGITCAANASFSSITSTSSIVIPARPSTSLHRVDRADAHDLRIDAGHRRGDDPRPRLRCRARAARSSLMTTTAAAPSFSGHALPAVTLPSGLNAGSSSCELLERRARPRAVVGRDDRAVLLRVRASARARRSPTSCAATARSCERCAKRSMSSRETS